MKRTYFKNFMAIIMAFIMSIGMNAAVFADTIPVIDMGTFHNVYVQPIDSWIQDKWEHEIKEEGGKEYILLKRYTGSDTDLIIYGKATAEGKQYLHDRRKVCFGNVRKHTGRNDPYIRNAQYHLR